MVQDTVPGMVRAIRERVLRMAPDTEQRSSINPVAINHKGARKRFFLTFQDNNINNYLYFDTPCRHNKEKAFRLFKKAERSIKPRRQEERS